MPRFVNRERELAALDQWWNQRGARMGLVWGRRRIGKSALVQHFAESKPVVYHSASHRPAADELRVVSRVARDAVGPAIRDLEARPFADWDDCFETLADRARSEPLLLVLDEFPELTKATPELESVLRAFWDRARGKTQLRVLLCGSAVSAMKAMQEERAPHGKSKLYGRFDISLRLDPFQPHEAAGMLTRIKPAERALVWGITGGVPLYLEWWDQNESIRINLRRLVATPGGSLLTEGDYVLATEGDAGDVARQILYAIAAGRTKYNEIAQVVDTNPSRSLDNLEELRLIERVVPVTETRRRSRRSAYRIADNFLAFWLGIVSRYRAEIDRGLGGSVITSIIRDLDDHMGPRWEEAFRAHLRRLAADGEIRDVVAVGPFWTTDAEGVEIDAVVLSGESREAILIGEAKWSKKVDGAGIRASLEAKAAKLPRVGANVEYAACGRERVESARNVRAFTAKDIF
jgi:hypothetical protein